MNTILPSNTLVDLAKDDITTFLVNQATKDEELIVFGKSIFNTELGFSRVYMVEELTEFANLVILLIQINII